MHRGQRSKFQSEKLLSCTVIKGQNFSLRNYCHASWSKVKISVGEIIVMHRGQWSKFQSEKLLSCIVCSQKSKFQSEKLLLCIVVKSQNFRRRNYCYVLCLKVKISVWELWSCTVVKGQNFSRRNYCYALCLKVKISLWEIMVMHRVPRSKFLVWEIIVMCNLNVLCIGSAYSIATVSTIFNPLVTFANFFQPI